MLTHTILKLTVATGKRDELLMNIASRRPALLDVLPERLRLGAG